MLLPLRSREALQAPLPPEPETFLASSFGVRIAQLSDARLTLLMAAVLFVLSAWPLLLVDLPPFQDLPNHVASAHIVARPDIYPEYAFNGFFKSNSLLMFWFHLAGGGGLLWAARVFSALVLALNAVALPLFVLRFAGRRVMQVSSLFLWPLVHGFFVSMGMLNFVSAFALSLILLVVLDRQRESPSFRLSSAIAGLAALLWFAHPLPMLVVVGVVLLHAARCRTWRARSEAAMTLLLPLAPAALLSLVAAVRHMVKLDHAPVATATSFSYLNPWELVSHLWLDVSGAFSRWGTMTLVPTLLLPYFAWRGRRLRRPFLSVPAMLTLAAAYVALPMMFSNWWYLNCRLVSFLWVGVALRLPERLPRWAVGLLLACAVSFSAVMGVDYVRLDLDREAFTAGMKVVPERATLLPLLFKRRKTSDFTASLTHAWAYYTLEKNASAPLVFAIERSYPITYKSFPSPALIPPTLDSFPERNRTPEELCKNLRHLPLEDACKVAWRELWAGFWREAAPHFSHVLAWSMTEEARSLVPPQYQRVFAEGELEIFARRDGAVAGVAP